jgi:type II secretory pathway component PulK
VFSERLETLRWLHDQLQRDLHLRDQQITLMHGQLPDTAQQEIVERFGRVDRYGQAQEPQILSLFPATPMERIRGYVCILEILPQQDEQATLNLGDSAAFLNVNDPDNEVEQVSDFMASGLTPVQVAATWEAQRANAQTNEDDGLLQFFGGGTAATSSEKPLLPRSHGHIDDRRGTFKGDYHFAIAALTQLAPARDRLQWKTNEAAQSLAMQERLLQLPQEVRSHNSRYTWCADPARLK